MFILFTLTILISNFYSQYERSYFYNRTDVISGLNVQIADFSRPELIFQMSVAIIILSVLIAGIAFAVGHSFSNYKVKTFAEVEIKQAIINMIIILTIFGVIAFINLTIDNFVQINVNGVPVKCTNVERTYIENRYYSFGIRANNVDCSFILSMLYLDRFYNYSYDLMDIFISRSRHFSSLASQTSGRYTNLWVGVFFGVLQRPNAGYIFFSKRYQNLFGHLMTLISFIRAQQFFLIISYMYVAPVLFLIGILFRSFFLTRKLGGLLISASSMVFIAMPLSYVMAWQMWADTYYPSSISNNSYCPAECTVRGPFAYGYNANTKELFLIYYAMGNRSPIPYNYKDVNRVYAYTINQVWNDSTTITLTDVSGNVKTLPKSMFVQCIKNEEYYITDNKVQSDCFNGCPQECREIPYPYHIPSCQQFERNCLKCSSFCFAYRIPSPVNYSAMPSALREAEGEKYMRENSLPYSSNVFGFEYCEENCYNKDGFSSAASNKCPVQCRIKYPPGYFDLNVHPSSLTNTAYTIPNFVFSSSGLDCTDDPNLFKEENVDVKLKCPLGCRLNNTREHKTKRPENLYPNCVNCDINACPDRFRFSVEEGGKSCLDQAYSACPLECRTKINRGGTLNFLSESCRTSCSNVPDNCFNVVEDFSVNDVCDAIPANCKVNYIDTDIDLKQIYQRSTNYLLYFYEMNKSPYDVGNDVLHELGKHSGKTGDYFFGCEMSINYTRNYAYECSNPVSKVLPITADCKSYSGPKFMPGSVALNGYFQSAYDKDNYSLLENVLKIKTGKPDLNLRYISPSDPENWTLIIQTLNKTYYEIMSDTSGLTDGQKTAVKLAVEKCAQCPAICRIRGLNESSNQERSFVCKEGLTVLCSPPYCSDSCKVDPPIPLSKSISYVGQCLGCSMSCAMRDPGYEEKCPDYCFNIVELPNKFAEFCPITKSKIDVVITDECENCYNKCDPACITIPPLRTNCNELCGTSEEFGRVDPNSVIDSLLSESFGGTSTPADIAAVSVIYIPAYVLPLFMFMLILAGIRALSAFLGGDIDIPGIGKVI